MSKKKKKKKKDDEEDDDDDDLGFGEHCSPVISCSTATLSSLRSHLIRLFFRFSSKIQTFTDIDVPGSSISISFCKNVQKRHIWNICPHMSKNVKMPSVLDSCLYLNEFVSDFI